VYRSLGCTVLEISPSHIFDVAERTEGFAYVSTHDAPPEPYARTNPASIDRLEQLAQQVARLGLDRVVLHPDRVKNWDLLKEYNIPWGIENLDARNKYFGTPDELESVLSEYDVPLVLDFNHCYTRDPSLALARAFQERFAGRIVEQHVSGYRDPSEAGRHLPLFETKQQDILFACDPTLPTIVEIDVCAPEVLGVEKKYVSDHFENQQTG